jgi:hypothetical protein
MDVNMYGVLTLCKRENFHMVIGGVRNAKHKKNMIGFAPHVEKEDDT